MTTPFARGACPSLSAPMPTGDGLLVRLKPVAAVPLRAFGALCVAAEEHGNGIIEVTARGSLQVRGLTLASAPRFAMDAAALGIDWSDGADVVSDPLPGNALSLIEFGVLAARLREAISKAGLVLAPKVSVVVDGGGPLHLDALFADLRLRVLMTPQGARLHLAVAGGAASAIPLALVAPDEVTDAALRILGVIARMGPLARAADVLREQGIAAFTQALGLGARDAGRLPPRPQAEPIGTHRLADGALALGIGFSFGQTQAAHLGSVLATAGESGGGWVRPVPGRALLLGAFDPEPARHLAATAGRHGFITQAHDPRRRIVACAGVPACAAGLIETRKLAAEIARNVALPGAGLALHVSGCAKGCAHTADAPLTVVGTEQGCGLVLNGSARARPLRHLREVDLIPHIAELAGARRERIDA